MLPMPQSTAAERSSANTAAPFHLDEAHPSCTYQPSQQSFTSNPTSSSLHSFWTSMLIATPGNFDISDPFFLLLLKSLTVWPAQPTSAFVFFPNYGSCTLPLYVTCPYVYKNRSTLARTHDVFYPLSYRLYFGPRQADHHVISFV